MDLQLIYKFAILCLHFRTKLVLRLYVLFFFQLGPLVEQNVGIGGVIDFSPSVTGLKPAETLPLDVFLLEASDTLIVELEPSELLGPDE